MCDVVVTYDAAVVLDDVEIWCWSGEGAVMRENEEPERIDTGDVGARICLLGERGEPWSEGD